MAMRELEPWQQRLIEEKTALDEKLAALNVFINGDTYPTLTETSKAWRRSQRYYMYGYSQILGQIVADFKGEDPSDEPS